MDKIDELEAENARLQAENRGLAAQGRGAIRALSEYQVENVRLTELCVQRLDRINALEKELMLRRAEPFTKVRVDEYAIPALPIDNEAGKRIDALVASQPAKAKP